MLAGPESSTTLGCSVDCPEVLCLSLDEANLLALGTPAIVWGVSSGLSVVVGSSALCKGLSANGVGKGTPVDAVDAVVSAGFLPVESSLCGGGPLGTTMAAALLLFELALEAGAGSMGVEAWIGGVDLAPSSTSGKGILSS